MYRLYVKSLWRETLENWLISDCVLSEDKLCNAFFCAFYINVCNLDNLEKLVYNQNDNKMVPGANMLVSIFLIVNGAVRESTEECSRPAYTIVLKLPLFWCKNLMEIIIVSKTLLKLVTKENKQQQKKSQSFKWAVFIYFL